MTDRLPQIDVDVDGQRLPERCARGFTGLVVQQHLSQPSQCELAFAQVEEGAADAAFALGARLRVGERGVPTALFEGRVSAIEYAFDARRGSTVVVRGYDELSSLRNRQSVRAHVDVTAADLARELLADLGIGVDAAVPGPVWQRVWQTGTDLELLADVSARCGLYFALEGRSLRLLTLEGSGALQMLRLNENLLEARFEANALDACRQVEVAGWDPWRGEPRSGSANSARVGRDVPLQAPASRLGGRDARTLVARACQDDRQADAAAQADLDVRTAQEVSFSGIAEGNPSLRPGARVQVSGVAPPVAGVYVIASARHAVDLENGYRSEISTRLPAARVRQRGTTMAVGRVTQVEDPLRLGRVQVALPAYADIETDWLQVLSPGAGSGKGLVALPDVGDLVFLLLEADDPTQAVVLGGLYGGGGLPPGHERLGKAGSFSFRSSGGQHIRLDDENGSVRVENQGGSSVELGPDAVTLRSAVPLTIEAPGQKIVFRARFIDFERG